MDDLAQSAREFVAYLKDHTRQFQSTMSDAVIARFGKNPFIILSSCLISLRARDRVTTPICLELFSRVSTPQQLVAFPLAELEKTLFSVGFYKIKALTLKNVANELVQKYAGHVPESMEGLLSLPGVGRKTANLVMGLAFDVPAICVDVHVHRISNQLGWVTTATPEETEFALQSVLPKDLWIEWNRQMVLVGQNGCARPGGCGRACLVLQKGFIAR